MPKLLMVLVLSILFLIVAGLGVWGFAKYYHQITIDSAQLQEVALVIKDEKALQKVLQDAGFWKGKLRLNIVTVTEKTEHGRLKNQSWGSLEAKVWLSPEILNSGPARNIAVTQQVLAALGLKSDQPQELFAIDILWIKKP